MPTYHYRCPEGHTIQRITTMREHKNTATCNCGKIAQQIIISAPMGFVKGDLPVYTCPITDKPITSRKEHEENLARHGCRILESGEKEEAERYRKQVEADLDAKVEATAVEFVEKLPTESREQLGRALDSGLDVSVERH
jgi:putative FmdB family regulatory protein